ncbi:hypothetical protein A3712_22140 [Vibrio sp. HI00D65]|uniref:MFS transporter n=1 Tax=Vibrio sp. HI00D65 TaxID=1822216 RepID=UPI0007B8E804|nr:MFS transporter [Vibrio sp. HI00D65]KZX62450.1 hypothetical protein A3712_22140 [Vibrio sp. HI00D65]
MIIFSLFLCFYIVNFNILFVFSLTPYLRDVLGFTSVEVGIFVSIFSATAFCINLLIGPVINKIGYRNSIVYGSFLCSIIFFLHAQFKSSEALIFLRFVTGCIMPVIGISILPYINSLYAKEELVEKTGRAMAASSLAQITSLPIGSLIGVYMDWSTPFYLISLLLFISFLIGFFFIKEGRPINKKIDVGYFKVYSILLKEKDHLKVVISFIMIVFSIFLLITTFPTWFSNSFSEKGYETPLVLLFSGLSAMIGSNYSYQFGTLINKEKPALGLLVLLTIFYVPIYIVFDTFGILISSIVFVVYSMFRQSLIPHLATNFFKIGGKEQSTHVSAMFNASTQIAISASALVSGIIYSCFGMNTLILISALISLLSITTLRK